MGRFVRLEVETDLGSVELAVMVNMITGVKDTRVLSVVNKRDVVESIPPNLVCVDDDEYSQCM